MTDEQSRLSDVHRQSILLLWVSRNQCDCETKFEDDDDSDNVKDDNDADNVKYENDADKVKDNIDADNVDYDKDAVNVDADNDADNVDDDNDADNVEDDIKSDNVEDDNDADNIYLAICLHSFYQEVATTLSIHAPVLLLGEEPSLPAGQGCDRYLRGPHHHPGRQGQLQEACAVLVMWTSLLQPGPWTLGEASPTRGQGGT